jgi:origin recognition complex subunit 5
MGWKVKSLFTLSLELVIEFLVSILIACFHCKLSDSFADRSEQINRLMMIFGPSDVPVPPIFVSGNSSTGKSSLIRDILETLSLPHAYISCVECGSQKSIFESVLNQLHGHKPCTQNNFSSSAKCQDLPSFIEHLQSLRRKNRSNLDEPSTFGEETRYIVFDNAERLRLFDSAFFFSLLRLDELSGINICTIFVTNVIRDHFENVLCTRPVLRVHFRDYSQQEAQEILLREPLPLDCEHEPNINGDFKALHIQFVRMLLDMFWRQGGGSGECRNIAELRFPFPELDC